MTHQKNNTETGKTQTFPVSSFFLETQSGISPAYQIAMDTIISRISSIDPQVIQKIATTIGISFIQEKEKESEVCFINSEEVRPEFKLSFTPIDLYHYIRAILKNPEYHQHEDNKPDANFLNIPFPENAACFWKLVQLDKEQQSF